MSRSPDLAHQSRDLVDTVRKLRRPRTRPVTDWVPVARSSNERNLISTGDQAIEGDTGAEDPTGDGFMPVFQHNWSTMRQPYQVDGSDLDSGSSAKGELPPVEFYIDSNGEVRMHGHITGGDLGEVVFVLPEGYRPRATEKFIVPSDTGGYAVIKIIGKAGDPTDGQVIVERISI